MNFAAKSAIITTCVLVSAFMIAATYSAVHERTKPIEPSEPPMSQSQHCVIAMAHFAVATQGIGDNSGALIAMNGICKTVKRLTEK